MIDIKIVADTFLKKGITHYFSQPLVESGVVHGFLGRYQGGAEDATLREDLSAIFKTDISLELNQIHSSDVIDVDKCGIEKIRQGVLSGKKLNGDAFVFNQKQQVPFLAIIRTADCLPVIIKGSSRLALVHAGWRGVASGIVKKAVEAVLKESADKAVQVVVGPHICAKCFEVMDDVRSAIGVEFSCAGNDDKHYYVDMFKAITTQVYDVTREATLHNCGICTLEDPHYNSYRRDQKNVGRNFTFVFTERF